MLCTRRLLTENVLKHVNKPRPRTISRPRLRPVTNTTVLFYSKRSSHENQDFYKIVKSGKSVDDIGEFSSDMNSNWELLSPKGYRFYMPGNVGPAWHDQYSTAQFADGNDLMDGTAKDNTNSTLECVAQVCPLLLRRGVLEMFPSMSEMGGSHLTIVTLSQKSAKGDAICAMEAEQEKQVKTFVLVAQEICMKLNLAGYWADFINPFSGRPYLSASRKSTLYKTDQRFRCLGFEITNRNDCQVIDSQKKFPRKFVGSLFTTAPASMSLLKDILNRYED